MRCLAFALLLCAASPQTAAIGAGGKSPAVQEQRLFDKWIVRSVRIDGKPTPAQIGQKVGDIISVERKGDQFVLS